MILGLSHNRPIGNNPTHARDNAPRYNGIIDSIARFGSNKKENYISFKIVNINSNFKLKR